MIFIRYHLTPIQTLAVILRSPSTVPTSFDKLALLHRGQTAADTGVAADTDLIQNQNFVEEKFKELDSDQIKGAGFEFLGLEIRFERNREI